MKRANDSVGEAKREGSSEEPTAPEAEVETNDAAGKEQPSKDTNWRTAASSGRGVNRAESCRERDAPRRGKHRNASDPNRLTAHNNHPVCNEVNSSTPMGWVVHKELHLINEYRIQLKLMKTQYRYSKPTWQHNQLTPRQHYRDKQIAVIDTWLRKITAAKESAVLVQWLLRGVAATVVKLALRMIRSRALQWDVYAGMMMLLLAAFMLAWLNH
ncbi:hypothetical protein MSG28_015826 [Choristoneura fumiferana]|uniref:Uncharacterized protein n=1 Tax=Choristoneura fumiferana TaxID=7141 RepID=A0ACC0KC70_CHOFU|nr:hypothetical protein MSG28_015826 [Choristoneura fumiferana]